MRAKQMEANVPAQGLKLASSRGRELNIVIIPCDPSGATGLEELVARRGWKEQKSDVCNYERAKRGIKCQTAFSQGSCCQRRSEVCGSTQGNDSERVCFYVRPSHTAAERTHIRGLYDIVRKKKNETGQEYYIDRRGPVSQWTIKERRVLDSNSSQQSASGQSTNP